MPAGGGSRQESPVGGSAEVAAVFQLTWTNATRDRTWASPRSPESACGVIGGEEGCRGTSSPKSALRANPGLGRDCDPRAAELSGLVAMNRSTPGGGVNINFCFLSTHSIGLGHRLTSVSAQRSTQREPRLASPQATFSVDSVALARAFAAVVSAASRQFSACSV